MPEIIIYALALSPLVILSGGLCWWAASLFISFHYAKKQWVQVPSEITKSGIETIGHHAFAEIEYTYLFNSETFHSDQIYYKEDFELVTKQDPEIIDQYPVASKHHCYVNPSKPAESALLLKIRPAVYIYIAVGLVFTICLWLIGFLKLLQLFA